MAEQKKQRAVSIQKWMTLLLLLILLPLFVLQGYRYYSLYQEKQQEALQANLEMARAVAKSFETFVQDVLRTELAIGLAITSSMKMTPSDIIRLLETSSNYPAVRDFTWLNPKGVAMYSNNPTMAGTDFSDRSYVRDVISGREWSVGELVTGKLFGKPIFGISRGIRDGKGELLGVIFAAIVPDRLDAQLGIERSKGGAVSIVDRKGILVYRYPALDTSWEERNWLRQYPEYEEVLKGKELSQTFFAAYEGKERLVSLVPISTIGWAAGAGLRKEDVTGPFIQSFIRDAVLFLSVSLIAFAIGVVLSRKITKPIETLRTYASSLGDAKVPQQLDVENVSELRDLAESFDAMAKEVQLRETTLRESEERFRSVLESASDVLYRRNLQNDRFDYVSPSVKKLIGYTPDEIMAMSTGEALAMIHPEDFPIYQAAIVQLEETGEVGVEYRQRARDGRYRWLSNRMTLIRDASGSPLYRDGAIRDFTERKKVEEALQESEDRLQLTLQASEVGTFEIDLSTGAGRWNAIEYELLGLQPGDAPAGPETFFRFVHPEDVAKLRAQWEKATRTGRFDAEFRVIRADGQHCWLAGKGQFVFSETADAGGAPGKRSPLRFLGVNFDITARKRVEEKLAAAHSQLQSIIDKTPAIVYAFDLEERFIMANAAVAEVLNTTPEQMIGKRRHEFMPRADADWHEANDRKAIEAGVALEFEEYSQLKDRSITWLTTKFPLHDTQGRIYAVAGISADISARKQAENALKEARDSLEQRVQERTMELQNLMGQLEGSRNALRSLASELVLSEERERKRIATVLHDEVCQTLAVAKMRVDMLREALVNDGARKTHGEAKEFLLQSIREARALMNEVGNPLLFDVGVRAACASLAERLMESHPIRIQCDIPDSFKDLDQDMKVVLYQLIRELLNNIVKHSGADNAWVSIRTDNGRILTEVRDDGMGFDPKTLGAPTGEGGFGLFSIQERLKAFNADLQIEAAQGKGTVVKANLPLGLEKST